MEETVGEREEGEGDVEGEPKKQRKKLTPCNRPAVVVCVVPPAWLGVYDASGLVGWKDDGALRRE